LIVLHVLAAFTFIGGLVGRDIILWQAARAGEVQQAGTLAAAAQFFDRILVIPGSFAVLGFGVLATWLRHIAPLGFIQGAQTNWLLISLLVYLSIAALVPTIFLPKRRVFEKELEVALTQQRMTPGLRASFDDRAVAFARRYELIAVTLIIVLMVARPF
jgi:hypothetical protein